MEPTTSAAKQEGYGNVSQPTNLPSTAQPEQQRKIQDISQEKLSSPSLPPTSPTAASLKNHTTEDLSKKGGLQSPSQPAPDSREVTPAEPTVTRSFGESLEKIEKML